MLFDHFEVATWAEYDLLSIKEISMDTNLKSSSPCNRGCIPVPSYITPIRRFVRPMSSERILLSRGGTNGFDWPDLTIPVYRAGNQPE